MRQIDDFLLTFVSFLNSDDSQTKRHHLNRGGLFFCCQTSRTHPERFSTPARSVLKTCQLCFQQQPCDIRAAHVSRSDLNQLNFNPSPLNAHFIRYTPPVEPWPPLLPSALIAALILHGIPLKWVVPHRRWSTLHDGIAHMLQICRLNNYEVNLPFHHVPELTSWIEIH